MLEKREVIEAILGGYTLAFIIEGFLLEALLPFALGILPVYIMFLIRDAYPEHDQNYQKIVTNSLSS